MRVWWLVGFCASLVLLTGCGGESRQPSGTTTKFFYHDGKHVSVGLSEAYLINLKKAKRLFHSSFIELSFSNLSKVSRSFQKIICCAVR